MLHLFYSMRVLSTFFTLLLTLVLLTIGGFFLAREMVLYWGINSFKTSLAKLELQAQNNSYISRCQAESEVFVDGVEVQTQLRFTSDTEYVLEASCSQLESRPILISKNELPPYITKVPGGSGVIWGNGKSAIELEVFRSFVSEVARVANLDVSFMEKRKVIGVEDQSIEVFAADETDLGEGPVTSCEGYGYTCCKVETQLGVGENITGLQECSESCYRSCSSRPIILTFNSMPYFDVNTRQVAVYSGAMVDFNYIVDAGGASDVQVSIDFGDGAPLATMDGEVGKLTHQYKCEMPECIFSAKIKAVDSWQVDSFSGPLSTISVKVVN